MPLPTVYPKRYRFGREFKRKDTSEYIKLFKFRFNKFPEFDEYFVEKWAEELDEIVQDFTEQANDKLAQLIRERAYADNASRVYYKRTKTFPDAFEVDVYIDKKFGQLHADIIFYYDYLMRRDNTLNGFGLPAHESLYGKDMRKKMPDILNTPVSYDYYLWDKSGNKKRSKHYMAVREGRWYETFDKWFRTDGEAIFLRMCQEHGIL